MSDRMLPNKSSPKYLNMREILPHPPYYPDIALSDFSLISVSETCFKKEEIHIKKAINIFEATPPSLLKKG